MADIFILDRNRSMLKSIFTHHSSPSDTLSFPELLKFSTAVRIYPVNLTQDLLSSLELKRLFFKAADKLTLEDGRIELAYFQFEKLLKLVASHCFSAELQPAERVQMLFGHIQHLCQVHYKANLILQNDVSGQRFESFDSSTNTKTVLKKQSSYSQVTPTSRKTIKKASASVARLTIRLASDSAATERASSKAQALKQKVQRLYRMISPKSQVVARKKPASSHSQRHLKTDLTEAITPKISSERYSSVPDSTRMLSDALTQYVPLEKLTSEKQISPLPSQNSSKSRDMHTWFLLKMKRAISSLETKTDLTLGRTKSQGKRKFAMTELMNIYQNSEIKVAITQRTKLKVSFLTWKLIASAGKLR